MFQITHIATGVATTISQAPQWVAGVWECGDHRFIDAAGTAYLAAPAYPVLTPIQFFCAFTVKEASDIENSTDLYVKQFYKRLMLAMNTTPPTPVDPNLVSVAGGVAYLAIPSSVTTPLGTPGPGILTAARVPQILAGVPQ